MAFIYLIIALFATTIGTLSGFGGGVIIKPSLDALGDYNVFVIGVLSSSTVLSMSIVSTTRRFIDGLKVDKILVLLSVGGIIGGLAGKQLFWLSLQHISPDRLTTIQAVILIALLPLALFKNKLPHFQIMNLFWVMVTGFLLGMVSTYLGIGGGPFNVAVLCMFFAMDIKEAAAGSIFIILFSQLSNLVSIAVTGGFGSYDYSILLYMIPASIAGGLIGSWLSNKISHRTADALFNVIVLGILLLNVYNILVRNI
jgi:uncharacterized membrane protein YfcA